MIQRARSRVPRYVLRFFLLFAFVACTPSPRMVFSPSQGIGIGTVTLGLSNVHALFGKRVVLVDTGSPGEARQLEEGLASLGIKPGQISCAVVTHGHADHAGSARWLQRHGVTIIAGTGDLGRMVRGEHGHLTSTSLFAWFLKATIPTHYAPFWPDIRVEDRFDLRACGVEGEVLAMPGHTAGSLVILVAGGKIALVGDLFRGGALAGYVHPWSPKEHFYQDDLPLVHRRIRELLARGVDWFVLGHGGPSSRVDVARELGSK